MAPGSLILLSGEPGIGKSTLALQMAEWYASHPAVSPDRGAALQILYISGEESISQISARAIRLSVGHENIDIITESYFDDIISTIQSHPAHIIIIDSLSVL